LEEGFDETVNENWCSNRVRFNADRYSLDVWHNCISLLRQHLRGWSANKRSKDRKSKKDMCQRLAELDKAGEGDENKLQLWQERNQVEARLEMIYQKEEIYWQQRSVEQWVLEGDANMAFFHSCANGRRRKTNICTLEVEGGVLSTPREISKHIVIFYKNLLGFNRN
jgi:hypothetical protein